MESKVKANKKLVHKADITWVEERNAFTCSVGEQTIEIAAALGAKKHDDVSTPEELFVSSIEGFIKDAFIDCAKSNDFKFLSYKSEAKAIMGEKGDGLAFSEIKIRIYITVALGSQIEKAHQLIKLAKDSCCIKDIIGQIVTIYPEIKAKC